MISRLIISAFFEIAMKEGVKKKVAYFKAGKENP
jgi:hypothetical protein